MADGSSAVAAVSQPTPGMFSSFGGGKKSTDPRGRKPMKPNYYAEALDWKIYRAGFTPGPGSYDPEDPNAKTGGGTWGKHKVQTYLDVAEKRGKQCPGPGAYSRDESNRIGGGRFSRSQPKSDIDWIVYNSKSKPGPADYGAPELPKPSGGKFNLGKSKSDVDWAIYRGQSMPAPGQYGAIPLPQPSGGKFNLSKPKGEIDWIEYRGKQAPGPGAYKMPGFGSSIKGGKFSMAKPKSDTDWKVYRAGQQPGPGAYNASKASLNSSVKSLKSSPSFSMASRPGPNNMPAPFGRGRKPGMPDKFTSRARSATPSKTMGKGNSGGRASAEPAGSFFVTTQGGTS